MRLLVRWWDRQGLRGGVLAGIGFAVVELVHMGALDGQVDRIAAWAGHEPLA